VEQGISRTFWKLIASASACASAVVLSFVSVSLISWRVILPWTEFFVIGRWKFALALRGIPLVVVVVVDDLSTRRCGIYVRIVPES
jgi:hypothetical protein